MELEAPVTDSSSIWRLHICTRRATDACQIGKERVLSAGLSVHGFATEQSLSRSKRLASLHLCYDTVDLIPGYDVASSNPGQLSIAVKRHRPFWASITATKTLPAVSPISPFWILSDRLFDSSLSDFVSGFWMRVRVYKVQNFGEPLLINSAISSKSKGNQGQLQLFCCRVFLRNLEMVATADTPSSYLALTRSTNS